MHYSLLPGHLLHMFLLWGEQVALERLLSVALHEVPHKGKRITLSSKGSEGQVTVGGWRGSVEPATEVSFACGWHSLQGECYTEII